MSDWPGVDLRGRIMLHPPWSRENQFRSDGEYKINIFPCPAIAVMNILTAYQAAGGSPEALLELLNGHFPAGYDKLDSRGLKDPGNHYSYEFQFYLASFTKILLDDPFFRYSIDENTQLPEYHGPLEQGPIDFAPWIVDDGYNKSGYISIVNVTVMFYYIEDEYLLPGSKDDQAVLGGKLSDEAVGFLNSCIPEKYRMDRDFFNKEGVMVSFEFMCLAVNLLRSLSNDELFAAKAFYYGFKNYSTLAKAIFLKSELSLEESFQEWQLRTNNLYNMEFQSGLRSFRIRINLRKQVQTGMFGLYRSNAVGGILNAVPSVHRAFIELSVKQKTHVKVIPVKDNPYSFWIRVGWRTQLSSPVIWFAAAMSGAVIFPIVYFSRLFISSKILPVESGIIISALSFSLVLLSLNWREKLKKVTAMFRESQDVISKQLDSLKANTNELLAERNALDKKVKERTAELNEALEQLKQLDRSKTNFIANVSHELRTPLTLLSVPLEGIKNGRYGKKLDSENHVFSLIERNVIRLKNQINQLLDFSRLNLGTMVYEPQLIELIGYCRGLAAELESLAEKKGLYLTVDNRTGAEKVFIKADHSLLETAVLNLLNNSLKFTENGGIRIIMSKTQDNEKIVLTVEDSGIGFTPEDKSQIFKRFTQAEESRERHREGAGLGLALVREIAERHGWGLEAEGRPGEGSEFSIIMQAADSGGLITADGSADQTLYSRRQERVEPGLLFPKQENDGVKDDKKDTILIVEDNPDMWIVLQDLLSSEYNLKWCSSGEDALSWLTTGPPLSLIICDVMMPGMSGFGFRRNLLNNNGYSNLPFIYLTALADPMEKAEGLKTGAVDYIQKPFIGNELLLKVRNLVESHKSSYMQAVKDRQSTERLSRIAAGIISEPSHQERVNFGITKAEQRVVELVRLGLQDKEIANELSVSPRTVSSHLSHLFQKTGTQNRVELINKLYSSN